MNVYKKQQVLPFVVHGTRRLLRASSDAVHLSSNVYNDQACQSGSVLLQNTLTFLTGINSNHCAKSWLLVGIPTHSRDTEPQQYDRRTL